MKRTISGFSLKLPVRYYKYFPPDYESDNFHFLKDHCKKGDVVIDVGAHIGLFSVCAAQLTGGDGKVYSFEPAPPTNALLKKTVSINHKQNIVEPRSEAVAEKEGTTFFYVSDTEGDNSNSLVSYRMDKKLDKVEVKITSVDNFVGANKINKINFIKIDAEGYECSVLKGAEQTFKEFRPVGILALHPLGIESNGDSLGEIFDFLQKINYKIVYKDNLLGRNEFCSKNNLFDVHLIPN